MPKPIPESQVPVSLDEAIASGLVAATAAAQELGAPGEPVTCRDIGRVFDTAIEHGAPIWNDGSQLGCARIYLQAARAILEKLRTPPALMSNGVEEVLSDLRQVDAAVPSATSQNANDLAWALRDLFDQFHYARGMEDVDQLIVATRASGGAIDADLICLCLTVAIAHGNNFYQKAIGACAVLHLHTARRVLDLLTELETTDGTLPSGLGRVRRELHPILTSHPRITEANAATLAWKLYEAFLKILKHPLTAEESRRQAAGEYQGFISYRRAGGSEAALAVRAYLQMRGLNTFLDVEGLDVGPFGPHLLRAIELAPNFLLILTPGSLERCVQPNDWLCAEIAHAIRTKRNIIPILKDNFLFPGAESLPPAIRTLPSLQAVTYSHEYFDAVIDRIAKYMRPAK